MMSSQLLYEDDEIAVWRDDHGSPIVLVTFNNIGELAHDDWYWGKNISSLLGLSCVGVVMKRQNWFPRSSIAAASGAIRGAVAGHDAVIAYGFSSGGYGAIKHSRAVSATHVIAFSPQFSIDPGEIDDPRYTDYFDAAIHRDMGISRADVAGECFAFFDPANCLDRLNVSRIAERVPATLVKMFSTGHWTVYPFSGARKAERLFLECLRGGAALPALAREVSRGHPVRAQTALERLAARKPPVVDAAAAILRKHAHALPAGVRVERARLIVQQFLALGRSDDAKELINDLASACPGLLSLLPFGMQGPEVRILSLRPESRAAADAVSRV